MVFGHTAQQIVQLPAATLATLPDFDKYNLPKTLQNVIARIYVFQITMNSKRGTHAANFKVTKIFIS
jgi:hypothetical protein